MAGRAFGFGESEIRLRPSTRLQFERDLLEHENVRISHPFKLKFQQISITKSQIFVMDIIF